ncbi:hypothetical protein SDC9_183876 [bioreactor metagenome]|uniref:Uncharacterized protein n=1 Tax=bioreactor metagenome TaxID=1076179 RepID=A0A645HBG4_9ZZZZ
MQQRQRGGTHRRRHRSPADHGRGRNALTLPRSLFYPSPCPPDDRSPPPPLVPPALRLARFGTPVYCHPATARPGGIHRQRPQPGLVDERACRLGALHPALHADGGRAGHLSRLSQLGQLRALLGGPQAVGRPAHRRALTDPRNRQLRAS